MRVRFWKKKETLKEWLGRHLLPGKIEEMSVTEREFPRRVRADVQRGFAELMKEMGGALYGVQAAFGHGVTLAELAGENRMQASLGAPVFEEVDVGEEKPVKCLKGGLWLGAQGEVKYLVLMMVSDERFGSSVVTVQVGAIGEEGSRVSERIFGALEEAVRRSPSYRGKVLSLEEGRRYSGEGQGMRVHKLRGVQREEVILPAATLELLERNVMGFVARREKIGGAGQSRKKGLLFYGAPGTGKTHTIHYLARALAGHTTLIITAGQVALLREYMTLARLLQPSMVVIEDADLIGRERTRMESACEEALLNQLLNEMDGLQEDADVIFVLTTNRPEALEAALTSRPGRVDQAIEFPLPDEAGREKLVRLYAGKAELTDAAVKETVKRTEGVSAAFIKELMRRAVQFHLEREDAARIEMQDVREAIEEMVVRGGELNRRLLGGRE